MNLSKRNVDQKVPVMTFKMCFLPQNVSKVADALKDFHIIPLFDGCTCKRIFSEKLLKSMSRPNGRSLLEIQGSKIRCFLFVQEHRSCLKTQRTL